MSRLTALKSIAFSLVLSTALVPIGVNAQYSHAQFVDTTFGSISFDVETGDRQKFTVDQDGMKGYAWGDVVGWINFSPNNIPVTLNCQDDDTGIFSGYAWGENIGWINFGDAVNGFSSGASQVEINEQGELNGNFWSAGAGWGKFDCSTTGKNNGSCLVVASLCVQEEEEIEAPIRSSSDGGGGGSRRSSSGGGGGSSRDSDSDDGSDDLITENISDSPAPLIPLVSNTPDITTTFFTLAATGLFSGTQLLKIASFLTGTTSIPTVSIIASNAQSTYVSTSGSSCPIYTQNLKEGDRGAQVRKVQEFLNHEYSEALLEDGIFGPGTDAAVKRFQSRYSSEILAPWNFSEPTGWWYKTTRAKANNIAGC